MGAPNLIQTGAVENFLKRLFAIKGSPSVAPVVSPELVPTINAWDPRPDFHWLRGVQLHTVHAEVAAVAGQYARVVLHNDSARRLATVRYVLLSSGSTVAWWWRQATGLTLPATVTAPLPDDSRIQTGQSRMNAYSGTVAVGPTTNMARVLASTTLILPVEVVLAPGGNLELMCGNANVAVTVVFLFSERNVEGAEPLA